MKKLVLMLSIFCISMHAMNEITPENFNVVSQKLEEYREVQLLIEQFPAQVEKLIGELTVLESKSQLLIQENNTICADLHASNCANLYAKIASHFSQLHEATHLKLAITCLEQMRFYDEEIKAVEKQRQVANDLLFSIQKALNLYSVYGIHAHKYK